MLGREDMGLADLAVPGTPEIHFEPEERVLLVHPGRLAVGEAQDDELNRGRRRVNVAFTLPPGAYATLVVKRLFHWTLEPEPGKGRARPPRAARPAASPPAAASPASAPHGFLARRRAEKDARAKRRAEAQRK